jgi:hypothetical protein
MTPTESIIAKLDAKIEALQKLRGALFEAREAVDAASTTCSSVGTGAEMLYVHMPHGLENPAEAAHALAKALGGQWRKERNGGKIDYRGALECGHPVCVFGAELVPEPSPLVL